MAVSYPDLICVLLFLPFQTKAQPYQNITLGSYLKAGDPHSSWLSPSKDFAFGFQEIEPAGNFLLAIWFNLISEKTITWYANRDQPLPSGSKVELNTEKGLTLTNSNGQEIWRTKFPGLSDDQKPTYAAMLDTGNFMMMTQSSVKIWQSFDEPTDTLLPTQVLNPGGQLISRYTEKNYSGGRFALSLTNIGNLALSTTDYPLYNMLNYNYLDYKTEGFGFQVVFNQSGFLYVKARNGSSLSIFSNEVSVNKQLFYQRVILEYNGVLRHYVYRKQQSHDSDSSWAVKHFAPGNICTAVTQQTQQTGSGVCGYNSYCRLEDDSQPLCICPPDYIPSNPSDELNGCFPNFPRQTCEGAPTHEGNYVMKVLQAVDWSMSDYEHYQNVSISWCRKHCLMDCSCDVAIFGRDGDCWKKKLPLTNGKNNSFVDKTAFIKVRRNDTVIKSLHSKQSNRHILKTLAVIILPAIAMIVTAVVLITRYKNDQNKMKEIWEIKDGATGTGSLESCFEFNISTIKASTNNFSNSNKLGQGGFGIVYKGRLSNGQLIAVKRLMRHSAHGEVEFKNEVKLVARLHHNNLVRLIGFCVDGNERILIYEYAPNGSLDFVLFDAVKREHLTWEIRYKIIQGIARGLLYLHEESQVRIFHRDLKASNVLLDENMNPKISDFGTARLFREDQTSASRIVGTYGYMAPEYAKYGKISVKIDVFSFGVLPLEIVSGKKNSISHSPKKMEHLLSKSWKLWTSGKVMELIDLELLKTDSDSLVEEITRCIHIGLLCVQKNADCRPAMNLVILMLECCSQCLLPPSEPAYLINLGDEDEPNNVPVMWDHLYSPTALISASSNISLSINQVSITDPYPEPR